MNASSVERDRLKKLSNQALLLEVKQAEIKGLKQEVHSLTKCKQNLLHHINDLRTELEEAEERCKLIRDRLTHHLTETEEQAERLKFLENYTDKQDLTILSLEYEVRNMAEYIASEEE